MNELKNLRYKRGAIKTQLTLFEKFIKTVASNPNEQTIINLENRVAKIEPLFDIFTDLQNELDLIDEDNTNNLIDREEMQDTYFNLVTAARNLIDLHKPPQNNINTNHSSSNPLVDSITSTHKTPQLSHIKLPRINLCTFDGSFAQWREFYDMFQALIHLNNQITDAQKLCYLKTSLKGEAAGLLASFETTDSNYNIAWQLLQDRYNNKRRIIHNHVRALLEMDPIQKESHVAIRMLIDKTQKHMRSLKSLDQPIEYWDALIIPIISVKLDSITNREWETIINNDDSSNSRETIPKYDQFISFLNKQHDTLEAIAIKKAPLDTYKYNTQQKPKIFAHSSNIQVCYSCPNCKDQHSIYQCKSFLDLNENDRRNKVKELKLCINCLRRGHFIQECKSTGCKVCNKKHNTLLHIKTHYQPLDTTQTQEESKTTSSNVFCSSFKNISLISVPQQSQVLLSTALVRISDKQGHSHLARALLDSGSQSCFISNNLNNKLNLPTDKINTLVSGVGKTELCIREQINIRFESNNQNYSFSANCLVVPNITSSLPQVSFDLTQLQIPQDLILADPEFNISNQIDILLGVTVFWQLISVGQIKLGKHGPILQNTRLGWIVAGKISHTNDISWTGKVLTHLSFESLDHDVKEFWKLEEVSNSKCKTAEEEYCEKYFEQTSTRDEHGRFIVKFPFKENVWNLGESYEIAKHRFMLLEKRLDKNEVLKSRYSEFMSEYIQLDHMSECNTNSEGCVFLPHHGVYREISLTTKLRVVFDASCKTTTGVSLNDVQFVGPTIQRDLFTILNNFRLKKYAITADIEKMYRQIWIHQNERQYQQILWRDQDGNLKPYHLNTITYGTASAPFLAIRCLVEIANLFEDKYPLEAHIIKNCFYVDDLLTGADTVEQLHSLKTNIHEILQNACFNLRKWRCNVPQLVGSSVVDDSFVSLYNSPIKTLGIYWDPKDDHLLYKIENTYIHTNITKRTVLASTAQIFDPLGLLAPVIIVPKLIIQNLWQQQLGWDDTIPESIKIKWETFKSNLEALNDIKIPRYIFNKDPLTVELHGFADASEQAYGACVYVKVISKSNNISVQLMAAKSRVAPLRTITLPRLELCAAVLISQLMAKIKESLDIQINNQFWWSDSTIVLCWLKSSPARWNTFVGNRVAEIQRLSNVDHWYHVCTNENPADLITRGTSAQNLIQKQLWWKGPDWLSTQIDISNSNINFEIPQSIPEIRTIALATTHNKIDIFDKFSFLNTLLNVVSYCIRFCINSKKSSCKLLGPISPSERSNVLKRLIKIAQRECFKDDIKQLSSNKIITHSKLIYLSPFLDSDGIMRVGGRLKNSSLEFEVCHQILLPAHHSLTYLIARHTHEHDLHCGPQALLYNLRKYYWPIKGRNLTRKVYHSCMKCFRSNPPIANTYMGDLPKSRTTPSPPFFNCGIDYAGPFQTKDRRACGYKIYKSYICIFICFSTKAMHIELVSDLTTECFLACLRRFIARRGKPSIIYSDNGTTFVGANNELQSTYQFLQNSMTNIETFASQEGITWKFIPPRLPHFGGLWESGVRSIKSHIKRVIGNTILTFESFYTFLTEVESMLNSRPISPMSENPSDLLPLTPGHFLIGRPLTSLPEPDLTIISENRLSTYQHVQNLTQHFWKRWQREYLNELQMKRKWNTKTSSPKHGDMVLLVEKNQPPLTWKLGRIVDMHPGTDGEIRVVTVKTASGIYKRGVKKLCLLPVNEL